MRTKLENRINSLINKMDNIDWKNRTIYASFVAQTYFYVCHSTRLLAAAASRIPVTQEKSYQRFIQHIKEENHHERLAINDLEAMGMTISDFKELSATQAFYQNQYYYIDRVSPWSLLGYILPLEAIAAQKGEHVHAIAIAAHGKSSASFLRVHAAEDVEHVEKAFQLIESLPADQQEMIAQNLETSCFLYECLLANLANASLDRRPNSTKKAA